MEPIYRKFPISAILILGYSVLLFAFFILEGYMNLPIVAYCALHATLAVSVFMHRSRNITQLFPIALIGLGYAALLVYAAVYISKLASYFHILDVISYIPFLIFVFIILPYSAAHIIFALQAAAVLIPTERQGFAKLAKRLRLLPSILTAIPILTVLPTIVTLFDFSLTKLSFTVIGTVLLSITKLTYTVMFSKWMLNNDTENSDRQ